MKLLTACLTLLGLISSEARCQDLRLRGLTQVVFATKAEGSALLSKSDDFVSRLSPFDRSARLKSAQPVDEATYLKFVSQQTLDWTDAEKSAISSAFDSFNARLAALKMQLPETILIIKTSGAEEGDAAYTRGNAIVLPQSKVKSGASAMLTSLMAHELFHVLSRHDTQLREKLYKSIGFERCDELKLPPELARKRITNPDAPIHDHYINIKVDGRELPAIPVLYSSVEQYDTQRGGEFFNYLVFEFLVVSLDGSQGDKPAATRPAIKDGKTMLVQPAQAIGFIDQVGRNTQYLIHPDEILADNFVLLVTGSTKVKSPDVLTRIEACFK